MFEKVIKVFYNTDLLPYKDKARTVHFPIVGSSFLGASETTKIRFYYGNICSPSNTLVAESKRPNGTTGLRILTKGEDEDGLYGELSLSSWYLEFKGDLYISLKCFAGDVQTIYDEEEGEWQINGTPIIQATGSIKLSVNYTPIGPFANYQDEYATYQNLLGQLGDKADLTDVALYIGSLEDEHFATYQALFNEVGLRPFIAFYEGKLCMFHFVEHDTEPTTYSLREVSPYGIFETDTLTMTDSVLPTYTHCLLDTVNCVEISGSSGTLNNIDIDRVKKDNSVLKDENGKYYHKKGSYSDREVFEMLEVSFPNSTYTPIAKQEVQVYTSSGTWNKNTTNYQLANTTWVQNNLVLKADKSYVDTGLSAKQNTLHSGQNIKTINNQSILGYGNIDVGGGSGSAEWGDIGGDIADQTDLQNELQDIREVAEGKCKTYILSYNDTIDSVKQAIQHGSRVCDENGNDITQQIVNGSYNLYSYDNANFNSQDNFIYACAPGHYLILRGTLTREIRFSYSIISWNVFDVSAKTRGDIVLVVETDVPDRWYSAGYAFYKLETSKVDLTNYATKTELATKSDLTNVAPAYDSTLTYTIGEVVINPSGKLVKANTNISTPEAYDATHWDIVSVASDFFNLTGMQVISGEKTFDKVGLSFMNSNASTPSTYKFSASEYNNLLIYRNNVASFIYTDSFFGGVTGNSKDLGSSTYVWKDLYLSGTAYIPTIEDSSAISFKINGIERLKLKGADAITCRLYPSIGNTFDLGTNSLKYKDLYLSRNISNGTNSVSVAGIANGLINYINASDIASNGVLTPEQLTMFTNGKPTRLIGTLTLGGQTINNGIISPAFERSQNSYICSYIGPQTVAYNCIASLSIENGTLSIVIDMSFNVQWLNTIRPFYDATVHHSLRVNGDITDGTNSVTVAGITKKPSTSYSLSDGGIITDNALKTLIQNEQPINLNGFTCYFSCDDGTNYQYVSTRYDSVANKNHINVITINKSTLVATFHTSDLALS